MGEKITRQEILKRLKKTMESKKPIVGAGASVGIVAKCAEIGGADMLIVYSTGLSRFKGLRTSRVKKDSNKVTLGMLNEIMFVTKNIPVIAGIDATEPPADADLAALAKQFINAGYSGIINFPTIGNMVNGSYRREMEMQSKVSDDIEKVIEEEMAKVADGRGFEREVELIGLCHEMDIFTMVYVFDAEQARMMAKAGADCVVAHAGGTSGGLAGFDAVSFKEAAENVQSMLTAAKEINPDIICMGHGGPFSEPEDTKYLYEHTDAVGYVGASSIERIPIEKAIMSVVGDFKNIPLRS